MKTREEEETMRPDEEEETTPKKKGQRTKGEEEEVSEASMSRNRSTIIVPAGSTRDEGWTAFRDILAEINEASRLFKVSELWNIGAPWALDDVGAGFISGNSTLPLVSSYMNLLDRPAELPSREEISGNFGVSKVIRADQKKFFFDLGSNDRGHYLRISEVAASDRLSIILPLSGLRQFHEIWCRDNGIICSQPRVCSRDQIVGFFFHQKHQIVSIFTKRSDFPLVETFYGRVPEIRFVGFAEIFADVLDC
ncbi:Transcription factor Pur-alpha 1-like protein [Drosera capensis]